MARMTKKQALALLDAAYEALDKFDGKDAADLGYAMVTARAHLREVRAAFRTGSAELRKGAPKQAAQTPLTGLEAPLPGLEG